MTTQPSRRSVLKAAATAGAACAWTRPDNTPLFRTDTSFHPTPPA
ncbi:twin-arginine translocation signal domain-containing protein [Nonomuraea jabiensis]